MTTLTFCFYLLVAAAGPLAVLAAGVPRDREDAPSLAVVLKHDEKIVKIAAGSLVLLLLGVVLQGSLDGPLGWIVAAVSTVFCAHVAGDRLERTSGSRAPLHVLAGTLAKRSASPALTKLTDLRAHADNLPDELRDELRAASDDRRFELICAALAGHALRTDRHGNVVWLRTDDAATAAREPLFALGTLSPSLRDAALVP